MTPTMIELEAKNTLQERRIDELTVERDALEAKLKISKRETDLKGIALRRANKFLSHRIDDVDHLSDSVLKLTAENKNLREGILVPPTEVVPVGAWETLEESREALTAAPYTAETA